MTVGTRLAKKADAAPSEWLSGTDLLAVAAWVLALILYIATCLVSQGFFTLEHTQVLVSQASVLGMLALAETFVLLVGGIDLSIPWTMTTAAIVTNSWPRQSASGRPFLPDSAPALRPAR